MDVTTASHRVVADLLRSRTGQQLTENRLWRVSSVLGGVFREQGVENLDQLVCLLAEPGRHDLATQVVEALINNETYFFRDQQMFGALATQVLPQLIERRARQRQLRIWSAGCSSGQELLSVAIILRENPALRDWRITLTGTDISRQVIDQARHGEYSQFEIQRGLGVNHMLRYFDEVSECRWRARPVLRDMMRFDQRSLLDSPPPGGPFDLILCRNVLLYFDQAARQVMFGRLHQASAKDGLLMMGAGETVVGQSDLFQPMNDGSGLFSHVRSDTGNPNVRARSAVGAAQAR